MIIIDDPLKAEEAHSDVARAKVIAWYRDTLLSRLNDKRKGAIILVMQRLHEEDLAGYLLERGGWAHLDLPAIAEEDQRVAIGSGHYHERRIGGLLHPEREPQATLDRMKVEMGTFSFSAQYLQRPLPTEGNLINRDWFPRYDVLPDRGRGVQVVQSWDVAMTLGDQRDYSVCTTWLAKGSDYYLAHVLRERLEFPKLKRRVIAMALQHGADAVLIENAGPGTPLLQELRADMPTSLPQPIGIKPEGNKIMRLQVQSAKIEAKQVWLPRDAPWLATFMTELLGFPNARHDDQVDSVSQFLAWVSRRRTEWVCPVF